MIATAVEHNLSIGFYRSAQKFPHRIALDVNQTEYTYQQLSDMAGFLIQTIHQAKKESPQFIALLAYRSLGAFAGVLGILGVGAGYVPLHPDFLTDRNLKVLVLSKTDMMIVSQECQVAFDELLKHITKPMTFILLNIEHADQYSKDFPQHQFIVVKNLRDATVTQTIKPVHPDSIAYLLFTSGSTGEPKGVPVSHLNARSYVHFTTHRYDINEHDRCSQMHDMTFDNSVHDIYVAWEIGACLCVASKADKLLPVSYIQKKKLTMWFSVPSVAGIIDKYGRLEAGAFPSLRYSFFAGEALYVSIAEKWQKAAMNSKIVNTYGPTETTVTVSYFDWDSQTSPAKCINGIVPLGTIFDGNQGRVMRDDTHQAAIDEPGELCLSGLQVTKCYWENPKQTQLQYVTFPDTGDTLWYRSGDLARQGADGCLYYLGRIDNQVKIQGNRVELGAIDKALREVTGVELAVSVPILVSAGNASSVVAFVSGVKNIDEKSILEYCRTQLPAYMVPTKVRFIDEMPLNGNGKVDRLQLQRVIERG